MSVDEKLLSDGTLHITVGTDLSKVKRVWLSQEGTHYGELYYVDAEPEMVRCKDCLYHTESRCCHNANCYGVFTKNEHYCGYAKRKEGGK